jgi:hypothetical protein
LTAALTLHTLIGGALAPLSKGLSTKSALAPAVLAVSVHNNWQHCNRILLGTSSIYPGERLLPMYTLIEYPVGVVVEAVVLSMETNRLRVAVAGFSDALEFVRPGLEWVTEGGQRIDVGFLQFGADESAVVSLPAELALAAGAAGPYATEG